MARHVAPVMLAVDGAGVDGLRVFRRGRSKEASTTATVSVLRAIIPDGPTARRTGGQGLSSVVLAGTI